MSNKNKDLINPSASFERLTEGKYRIFGIEYPANQILKISANGQQTLDGNKDFYFKPEFKFEPNDQAHIQDKFKYLANLGKERGINVDGAILVPTKHQSHNIYHEIAPRTMPQAYGFSKPSTACDVLCIPFEKGKGALPFGVFALHRDSLSRFASFAASDALSCAENAVLFQDVLHAAFACVAQERILLLSKRHKAL